MTKTQLPPWPTKSSEISGRLRGRKRKSKNASAPEDAVLSAVVEGTGAVVTPEAVENLEPEFKELLEVPDNVVFKPNSGPQTEFLSSPEQEIFYGGPLALDTEIPTPSGWTTLENIQIGDSVFAEDGTPTKVIFKSDKLYNKTYRITFSSGEQVVADSTHLWKVYSLVQRQSFLTRSDAYLDKKKQINAALGKTFNCRKVYTRSGKPQESTVSTEYMFNNNSTQFTPNNFSVENAAPISLPRRSLPVEPYLFGLWLGDGNSRDARIGCLVEDINDMLLHIRTDVDVLERNRDKEGRKPMRIIKFGPGQGPLKGMGVINNKHIPMEYLRSSFEQRLSLLQGIMDTDGTATKDGKCCITLKSEVLIKGVHELVSSLGIKTRITTKIAKNQTGYTCLVYKLQFNTALPMFKLKRKLDRQKIEKLRPVVLRRYITNIEEIDTVPTQCITVEHASHTFLITRSFIKTHNSKGGGKTYALLVDPLRYCAHRAHRALLLRRSIPDLKDIVFKAKTIYPKAFPGTRWSEQDKTFYFPSGARIEMGYCETVSDLVRYQGQNYTYIGVDEICQFPFVQEMLNYLLANIRTTDPDNVPPLFRCTGNPGEVSSEFMKKYFVDPAVPGTTFWNTVNIFDPRTNTRRKVQVSRKFIKATVFDNPYLLQDDTYLATLASLPETKRKQWLDGDWDVSDMSAFPEFDRNIHVSSQVVPRDCKRVKGADWGFSTPGACYWGAPLPSGQLYIYREFVFQRKTALQVAQEGRAMEMGEPKSLGILDASAWQQRGTLGQSIGEVFQTNWSPWRASSRARTGNTSSRAHRKNLVHQYLAINPETGEPRMVISPVCRKLIEALAGITVDKNNPEVVDTDSPLDHYYDALSYLLMGRPLVLKGWSDPFINMQNTSWAPKDSNFGY